MSTRVCCDDSCCSGPTPLRAASPSDHGAIVTLLTASGLPTSDIAANHITFTVADGEAGVDGVVGLECFGAHALLRSLAVAPARRGRGLGHALVSHALQEATERGVHEVHLLTTTAPLFFESQGFERTHRDHAPSDIRNSTEFASLCPASAVYMRRVIGAHAAEHDPETVRTHVRDGYAKIARAGSCGDSGGCCGPGVLSPEQLAHAIGYTTDQLAAAPDDANMGLSCGNPTALASLRPGETVLDLGAGGGFDCFIAGPRVGAAGRVIGVDMTPDMLAKARRNIALYRERTQLDNVEFRLGEIEALPVADASVDVVISNCVLNLSPDKARVWREIARVLKPGGRVAVSDLALLQPLPRSVKASVEALVGCVAGAVLVEETRAMASAAGLTEITLTPKPQYIDAMANWKDPLYRRILESLPAGAKPSDYITSLDVSARKAR